MHRVTPTRALCHALPVRSYATSFLFKPPKSARSQTQAAVAGSHQQQSHSSNGGKHIKKRNLNSDYCDVNEASLQATGILQLGQFNSPQALLSAWQEELLPACQAAWGSLRADTQALLQQLVPATSQQQQQQPWSAGDFLLALDALLGELQEVLLLCGLLKDQHSSQQWRSAAAAVFVEARTLEQDICSDLPLQQGLLLACKQLQQQLQQQQQADSTVSANNNSTSSSRSRSNSGSSSHTPSLLLLGKALLKHMQLEGLSPLGFAGLKPNQDSEPQVLSAEEQATLLSGLQAEQRLLVKRVHELLLSPGMAPVVQMDAGSREVLLGPLQEQAAVAAASAAAEAAVPEATDRHETGQTGAAAGGAAVAAAAAAAAEETDLVLSLSLVQQLLEQHPNPEVRRDVYEAGLLQQLDRLLAAWGQLAEVRRKIARMQGSSSYADWVLQHSLLGS